MPDLGQPAAGVRARTLLGVPAIWIFPLAIPTILILLITTIYLGSVVDPAAHLHGLPVLVVDEDTGATTSSEHVDLGQQVVAALQGSTKVTDRLQLKVTSYAEAEHVMDRAGAFATVVVPTTFTESALAAAGAPTGSSKPPGRLTVQLLENIRLGSLGVSLAAAVVTPAVSAISQKVGQQLTAQASPAVKSSSIASADLADPVTLSVAPYRPLDSHSAVGLSAFYIALISIMCGFLGATVVNSSMDGALGYATSDIGPKYRQNRPMHINRRETLLLKYGVGLGVVPVLTAVMLLIGVGLLGLTAPHVILLWLVCTLGALMVACAALSLLAAFGSIGQLLGMVLLVYLSLASSGGTIPIQALPGFFRVAGDVEPLRQLLGGTRAIMFFGARADAGLSHAVLVLAIELAFWLLFGLGFTTWYDRRGLYRLAPEIIDYIEKAASARMDGTSPGAAAEAGSPSPSG